MYTVLVIFFKLYGIIYFYFITKVVSHLGGHVGAGKLRYKYFK